MKLTTVQQYRDENPEVAKNYSDEQIANAIIEQGTLIRQQQGLPNPQLDYYQSMKIVNPNSRFVNVDSYKNTLDAEDRNKKTNLEFAREAYEKIKNFQRTGVSFPDFANEFAPRFVESNALEYPGQKPTKMLKPYSSFEIAKVKGYETEGDTLPLGRLATSFAVDRENKIAALNMYGEKYFGSPVNVQYDPEIQQLVFFNPKIGRMQTVNKQGLDLGDFASVAGDVGVVVSEAIGSIAGGLGGALVGPFTGATGAAVGGVTAATGAEMGRLLIGQKLFGLNPELKTTADFLEESKGTAGASAIGGALGMFGNLAVRAFNRLRGMGRVDPDVFDGYVQSASRKRELADNINQKLTDKGIKERLNISLAQATDDPELQMYFGAFRDEPSRGKVPQMIEFDKNNAKAMMEYYDVIREPFGVKDLYNKNYEGQQKTLKAMHDLITKETTKDQVFLSQQLAKTQDDLTGEIIDLPSGNIKTGGQVVRNHIQKVYFKRKQDFDKKFDLLFKADGGQRKVNTDLISKAVKNISAEQRKTLFSMYPDVQDLIKLTNKGKPIKSVDLKTIHTTISQLLNHSRNLQKGKILTETAPDVATVNSLVKSLNDQMVQDLGKDDVWLKFYTKVKKDFKDDKEKFGGVLGKLVEKTGGRLKIADEDVFSTSFKKDGGGQFERIDDVMSVIKNDPMAHDIYKKNVTEFYLDSVDPLRTGKIKLEEHQKFMKNYDYSLRAVFGPEGAKDIKKVGGLQKKITEMEAKNKIIEEEIAQTTGGLIKKKEPEKLFSFVFKGGDFGGAETKVLEDVMNIVKKDEPLKKKFQTVVSERMLENITNPNDFGFKPNAMTKFLDKNRRNLEIVFKDNPDYIKNLDDFNEILLSLQKKQVPKPDDKFSGALNDILRTRVGMFTVEGRAMTAAIKLSQKQLNERMFKLLTDPKGLEKMMKFAKESASFLETPAGQAAAIDLFGTAPFMMINGVSPNQKYTPSEVEDVTNQFPEHNEKIPDINSVEPQSQVDSPTVDMFAMQTPATQPASRPSAPPAPPAQQGIAAMQPNRAQQYAGLFPNDPSGQMIAQGKQNA